MKRVFSIVVISCIVALSGLFSSCKPQEEGEWMYYIQLDSSTDGNVAQDVFFSFIEPTMLNVMKNDADRYTYDWFVLKPASSLLPTLLVSPNLSAI